MFWDANLISFPLKTKSINFPFFDYLTYICGLKNYLKNLIIMSNYIHLRKGLNIPVSGKAEARIGKTIVPDIVAVKPTDFRNMTPKLLVKEGDAVKAGSPVFCDKYRQEILFTSPCSGTVESVVRGEKRKLLEIRIKADKTNEHLQFQTVDINKASREDIVRLLLESGMWPAFKQRPYGIIPNPNDTPRDIFISGFNTAPLAADLSFTLKNELDNIQTGINAIAKLTKGKVYLSLSADEAYVSPFKNLKGVSQYSFSGPHPAGNVGVQIHHIAPVNKGETVWTIDLHLLAVIGKLFSKGICDMTKTVAITGPRALKPEYVVMPFGSSVKCISEYIDKSKGDVRIISGDILSGEKIAEDGFLGFYNNQITLLEEGNKCEMFGWMKIFRPKKFSVSRSYFSWLTPKKQYDMDTNLNGGPRAFVVSGLYEKVVPMDILPVYLLKAILAGDIDKMEELGIYEVIEEDLALCEYVCPSKIEVQSILSSGIDLMLKEMA